MTTKLTAKRFRIRRPDPAAPAPAAASPASIFEPQDDGFGEERFPTAAPDDIQTPADLAYN
ncbi:MAG TPA: capsule biosynthesis protein, partial [Paracoccaceae bacterium]